MNSFVFIIFSLLLLLLVTTTASQLVEDDRYMKKCLEKERDALLLFKAPLQDPDDHLSTWIAEDDECCKWRGVTCNNQTGHITELDIYGYGLVGEIGHSLLNLTHLNLLDLSYNSLNGTIPTFIGSMTRLRHLDLSDNSFYGILPPEFENLKWLSHLSHLEELHMDGISLAKQNHWVDVILSLRKLSVLSLRGCELSQVMHPYSSFLNSSSSSSIVKLYLRNNNLTSSMYGWLFPLTSNKLHLLDLSSNKLDGIPKYLGNLCSLEELYFKNNSAVIKFPVFLNNLSGCTSLALKELSADGSQFTGSLSDEIQKFSSLQSLVLCHNHLNGSISEKLWELPMLSLLDVSFNSLRGAISEKIGKSKLSIVFLSENLLKGVPSKNHMSSLSSIQVIDLSSCNLGPRFPKWIQTLKNLILLNLFNTGISDTTPLEFWDMSPSQIAYMNLSYNNISGKIPDLSSNFANGSIIDLSSNNFSGPIPNVSSTMSVLNLSRNKFSGGISFICQIVGGLLSFLDLSHNSLSGQLPDCLWHFKELQVLNLGHNNLFGSLPPSIGSLIQLQVLYLYKNNFSGELPLSLKNCTISYTIFLRDIC